MATMNVLTQSIKERIKDKLNQKGKEILLFLLMENQEHNNQEEPSRIESPQVLK